MKVLALLIVVLAIACDPTKSSPAARVKRQWSWGGDADDNRARPTTTVPPPPTPTTPAPSGVTTESEEFLNCFRNCPATNQYNPVCATNSRTYDNPNKLDCANRCGLNIQLVFFGTCQPL